MEIDISDDGGGTVRYGSVGGGFWDGFVGCECWLDKMEGGREGGGGLI